MIQVPARAYQLQAQGVLSVEDIAELEQTRDILNKEASLGDVGKAVALGAGTAAGGALAAAAGHYFAKGVAAAEDAVTFNRDLKSLLAVHPELGKDYSDKDVKLVYQSIRTLNPIVAKDPLMGGTLLGQVLRNRNPQSPAEAPRFDPQLQKTVAETGKSVQGPALTRAAESAFHQGFSTGLEAFHGRNEDQQKMDFEMAKEKMRAAASKQSRTSRLRDLVPNAPRSQSEGKPSGGARPMDRAVDRMMASTEVPGFGKKGRQGAMHASASPNPMSDEDIADSLTRKLTGYHGG